MCYFADIYFGVEVGCECFVMIAGIAVYDVEIVYLVEMVFCGIGCECLRNSGVESASEDGG